MKLVKVLLLTWAALAMFAIPSMAEKPIRQPTSTDSGAM